MTKLAQQQPRTRRHTQDSEKNRRVPSLRLHKASGRAYVVLSGKAVYCGRYGDPEAQAQYHQVIAEWLAAGQQLPADPATITIKELLARFWTYAEQYYRTLTDGRVKELEQFRLALRPLKELYANTPATDFGPRALKTVQQRMIDMGWCRPYVNKQLNRIRHIFRWAVSDEMIPGSVLHALQAVSGLRRGRSDAPEPEAVKPVAIERVNAIQPFTSRQVWAMVQLQLFTAARAGEIVRMRPCDIDRTGEIWVYRLQQHKTAHRGFEKKIWIGPRGQQVLAPYLVWSQNSTGLVGHTCGADPGPDGWSSVMDGGLSLLGDSLRWWKPSLMASSCAQPPVVQPPRHPPDLPTQHGGSNGASRPDARGTGSPPRSSQQTPLAESVDCPSPDDSALRGNEQ